MDFTTNGTLGKNSTVTNGYTGETFSVAGKRGSTGIFTASGGDTTLYGDTFAANLNDAFIYDFTIGGTNALRFSGITEFNLGAGDDLLDLTVRPANAASAYTTNVTAYGGVGDDVIWGGDGRDTLYGDVSALSGQGGDDVVRGGGSSNTLYGDATPSSKMARAATTSSPPTAPPAGPPARTCMGTPTASWPVAPAATT